MIHTPLNPTVAVSVLVAAYFWGLATGFKSPNSIEFDAIRDSAISLWVSE